MSNQKNKKTEGDEVEELLRAAEDELLLNLSLNSHMSRTPQEPHLDADHDDLLARFAALKGSISEATATAADGDDDDDEEDEVDKVIRWAMDAARLENSPPTHQVAPENGNEYFEKNFEAHFTKLIRGDLIKALRWGFLNATMFVLIDLSRDTTS
ncbi:hypothetical protein CK203_075423 [Vitis vinifera]|uniref:Uncharacterized protein n=1 Tax=Vitis vinifera TaxID=29760 RepID=A0A438EU73_VITVI|nr:hypothetical protein CK203_075423 [Vitis vinifera]